MGISRENRLWFMKTGLTGTLEQHVREEKVRIA